MSQVSMSESQEPLRRNRGESLLVVAEATGETPRRWAWAIYFDADQTLIARSRSLYQSERDAREAGSDAAAIVTRNLQRLASRASVERTVATFWKT